MVSVASTDDVSALLLDSASGWLADCHTTDELRGVLATPRRLNRERWREMAGLGWLALGLPEALGGSDLDLSAAAALSELFGRKLLPEPFVAAAIIPTAIVAATSGAAQTALADELASGERILTLAWQTAACQLDPPADAVTLTGQAIAGQVCFVPAVEDDGVLLVAGTGEDGDPVIVAVEASERGIAIERRATGGGGTVSTVTFEATPIRFGSPILRGEAARDALCAALERGRIGAAAQLVGVGSETLTKTLEYIGERRQFDRPIASFQTVQHRCVDLHIGVLMARASYRAAARAASDPVAHRPVVSLSADAAAAKARAGDVALQIGRTAVQLHGAMGFTEENDTGLYLRAALQLSSWLGTPTQLRRRFSSQYRAGENDNF